MSTEPRKRMRRQGKEDAGEALRRARATMPWGSLVADLPYRVGVEWWEFRLRSVAR
jgi:hypothetical protein